MTRRSCRSLPSAAIVLALIAGALSRSELAAKPFAAAGASVSGTATPKTLVSVRGRMGGFAQDGARVAWLWPTATCRNFVQLRDLRTGKQVRLAAPRGATCPPANAYVEGALALAGERALWAVYDEFGGNTVVDFRVYVIAGRVGTRDRVIQRYEYEEPKDDSGDVPLPAVPMAGDGATLVYADRVGLRRVLGGRAVKIGKLTHAATFALAAGRIAVAEQSSLGGCVCNSVPAWSPDGSRLAFVGSPDAVGSLHVYVVSAAGGEPHLLVDGVDPQWSPDGTKIAFGEYSGEGDEGVDLVVADADGTNQHVLVKAPVWDWAWSPDGSRLVFNHAGDNLTVIRPDGTGERVIATNASTPAWSPDGTKLAFSSFTSGGEGPKVEIVNDDGSDPHAVASGWAPRWSPDGTKLVYQHDRGIHVVWTDGTGATQFTHSENSLTDAEPAWSPDGTRILFERVAYNEESGAIDDARIWLINSDGSGQRRLTTGAGVEWFPAWSPDGAKIAFARGGELYVARADGAGETRVTTTHPVESRSAGAIYAVASGRRLHVLDVTGTVRAAALSKSVLALLVEGFFGKRIELFDSRTGAASGGVPVDPDSFDELSAADRRIVFSAKRQIMLLDAAKMRVSRLTTAAARPIGLSIEGRRVAWAENLSSRARVRALTAP